MIPRAVAASVLCALAVVPTAAQRRGTGGASVTFVVLVTDASGAPIPDAAVILTGPVQRTGRTESGRLAFEGLPAGAYRFRFDKAGYVSLERELTARGSAPIDVKVTLDAAPPPPHAPAVPVAPPPAEHAKPMALDLPTYIKDNYVGRAPGKTTALSCTTGGAANLLQINDPMKEHTHPDSDEILYVIAGEGNARIGSATEPMSAGVFLVVPRGVPHALTAVKKPLVVLSILAGDKCS